MRIYFSKLSNSHFPHEIYVHDILLMLNKFLYFNICLVPCSFVEFMKKSSFHVKHVCNIDPSNGNAYIVNSKRKEFNWRIQYDLASNFCRFVIIILLPQLPNCIYCESHWMINFVGKTSIIIIIIRLHQSNPLQINGLTTNS